MKTRTAQRRVLLPSRRGHGLHSPSSLRVVGGARRRWPGFLIRMLGPSRAACLAEERPTTPHHD